MHHANRGRLSVPCSLCEAHSAMPPMLVAFYVSSGGYKTRYRLCWACGYQFLKQFSDWRKLMQS